MENREKIIELMLGLIFIAILLLVVFFVLTEYEGNEKNNPVSNTYNTNTNNYYVEESNLRGSDYDELDRKVLYLKNDDYHRKDGYFGDYSSYGRHTKEKDFVGSYVDDFRVYIKNTDSKNKYFKIRFYFKDYDGHEFTRTVTKYIRSGEREEVRFRDVQFEKNKYKDWDYEIIVDSDYEDNDYYPYRDHSNYYGKRGFDYVYY